MPQISIIVPVYNAEQYLSHCIDSVLSQSFSDIELILVDDGSPDRSGEICDRYAEQDPRVRVIHKENGGVSTARNAGLDVANGDYITFVDSDDFLDDNMYEKMMAKAREYNSDVVLCDCLKEYADRSVLYTHDIRGGFYNRDQLVEEYFPHLLMMENVEYPATISNWLLLFRRELTKQVRYLEGVRYSEDLLFGAELMYCAKSFYYMKGEAYYHYRMNLQSATHKFVPDKWNDYCLLYSGIRKTFGNATDYDFTGQIDLCVLFFLYNAMGDIHGTDQLTRTEKTSMIADILNDKIVRDMFSRVRIGRLSVSLKQKLLTMLYKKRWAIRLLCIYFEQK